MRIDKTHRGLTLLETLVAAAIILTLIGVLATASKKLRLRSEIDLTRSTMGVLETALEVYFNEHDDFVPMASDQNAFRDAVFGIGAGQTVTISSGTFPAGDPDWDNAALYYFLNRDPQSRSIVSALSPRMLSGRDAAGTPLAIEVPTGAPAVHWVRVLDAWGTPLDYLYNVPGATGPYTLPILRSAGPDRRLNTEDDITNE